MARNKSKIADSYIQLIPVIDGLSDEMSKQFKEGFEEAEKQTAPISEESGKKSGGKFAGGMLAAVAASGAAAAIGSMFADAVTSSLDQMNVDSNLQASLSLNDADLAKVADVAKDLRADSYGLDYADIANTMKTIVGTVKGAREMSAEELRIMGRDVDNVAKTWELSAEEVTTAASSMVNNGMAENFGEAVSTIAAGYQTLGGHADGFLDTVNEFGGDFKSFGLTGSKAVSFVSEAIRAGMQDTERFGDALNEMSITINTGDIDDTILDLGIDPDKLRADIKAGGEAGQAALIEVLTALQKDGNVANYAKFMSSIGEDFTTAFMNMDMSAVNAGLGETVGNLQVLDGVIHSGPQEAMSDFRNTFEEAFNAAIIPLLVAVTPLLQSMTTFFKENEWAAGALAAVVGIALVAGFALATFALWGMAAAGWAAAIPIIAMSWPVWLVVAAVLALGAAWIWMADQFGGSTNMMNAAWKEFSEGIIQMWDTIKMIFGAIGDFFAGAFSAEAQMKVVSGEMPMMADGGTVRPKPGGTPVILAEAGRAETVVDTGKFNRLLDDIEANGSTKAAATHIEFNISTRDTESAEETVAKISEYLEFVGTR